MYYLFDIIICLGDVLLKIKKLNSKQISLSKLTRLSVFFCRVYDDSWGIENLFKRPFLFNSLFATSFPVLFSLKLGKALETSLLCLASGAAHSPFFPCRFGEMLNKLKIDQINDTEVSYFLHQLFMTAFFVSG